VTKEKIIFNWSGGKDSALCLHKILQRNQYEILCLLTTISELYQRISMHGVRIDLLEKQAEMLRLPLVKVSIPETAAMEQYDNAMNVVLSELKLQGATLSAFGDIFLEDLREYREQKLAEAGLKGMFPLWKIPTGELARKFVDTGFKAIVTCVNEKYLDKSYAGRIIDHDFLKDLPDRVDPCGENGEFHSFVFDGPIFNNPVPFQRGKIVYRKYNNGQNTTDPLYDTGFWYCDLVLSHHE
jgi:uncharacterized protein (TIGR00290 family)